jgi:hypothetical protein
MGVRAASSYPGNTPFRNYKYEARFSRNLDCDRPNFLALLTVGIDPREGSDFKAIAGDLKLQQSN